MALSLRSTKIQYTKATTVLDGLVYRNQFYSSQKIGIGAGSAYFDGSSYINFGTAISLSTFTVSFWVNALNISGNRFVYSAADSASDGVNIFFTTSTNIRCVVNSNTMNTTVTTGEWVHFALVSDGSNMTSYVNGRLVSTTASGAVSVTATPRIGTRSYSTITTLMLGFMQNVSVWNVVLTQDQINAMRFTTYETLPTTTGLVHYWKLYDQSGTTIPDSHGTNTGTAV